MDPFSSDPGAADGDILNSQRRGDEIVKANKQKKSEFRSAHALSIAFLLLIFFLHVIGIYLFTNGFLLSRLVLDRTSECSTPPILPLRSHTAGSVDNGCWHPKSFDRAVILLIDALRYDFTVPFRAQPDDTSPHHFHNSLTIPFETASQHPQNAVLRPFIADAPTTTLQRLKALTTGTLPTFIDAGSNFAGYEIEDDNLLSQLRSLGKRIVQLGDDTWHSLFPNIFDPELTKPYDSFNVWDLFTVDNGVTEHLIPLLQPSNVTKWDVLIGHFLGVDHAGHQYGPDHPAMASKLKEMDDVLRKVVSLLDDNTLLILMGDHGMDVKGDHGGESDDEVEAALWMYSKRDIFGRDQKVPTAPPSTAKERPVSQIDLVPTLALLLGLPIPFSNLGTPIEEAFIGTNGKDYENLASVNRLAAAQIYRYQDEYAAVRKLDPAALAVPEILWDAAIKAWDGHIDRHSKPTFQQWESLASAFLKYQQHNLEVFRSIWSRFDLLSIGAGVATSLLILGVVAIYARCIGGDSTKLHSRLCISGSAGLIIGGLIGYAISHFFPQLGKTALPLFLAALFCCTAIARTLTRANLSLSNLGPNSVWSYACFVSIVLLSGGFAANSFTIWEDEILLFFLSTFGLLMFTQAFRLKTAAEKRHCCYHSVIFLVMIRLASLSRLCRDEQFPYCKSTFYASAGSSTSAPWQLGIPYLIAIFLPTVIKSYFNQTSSYQGSAPFWIGFAFRGSLLLIAVFWTLETSANDSWWTPYISDVDFKTVRMYLAQFVLMVAAGAGTATFGWQSPLIGIERVDTAGQQDLSSTDPSPKTHIMLKGTNNLYGSHFAILPFTVLLIPLLLLQKPMGQASLTFISIAILSLLELLSFLKPSPQSPSLTQQSSAYLGPTLLALLGHFAYFKTGHQAAIASIQWDVAYIPLRTIRYPWTPLFLLFNNFGGQILCAAAVPLVVLWRRPFTFTNSTSASTDSTSANSSNADHRTATSKANQNAELGATLPAPQSASSRRLALLAEINKAYLTHILVYATINVATSVFAAHLRRHLMLYRVFSPRWMLGCIGMIVAELFGIGVGFAGVAWTVIALGTLFGW